jgi:hypothetical protein
MRDMCSLTRLVSIEYLWDTDQVDGHSQLRIRLNVQVLVSRKP